MRITTIIFLIYQLFTIPFCLAQQTVFTEGVSNVGTTSAAFLNIGVGARAIAMGSAFTAVADDATALFWNPAGIGRCKRAEVTFNHSDWLLDVYHEYIGAILPAGRHCFGASVTYLGMPDQIVRTIEHPEGNGNFYNAADLAIAASYAFEFTDQFAMGFTGKYIRQQIYNTSASAIAIDFGAIYQPSSIKWLKLGMQISNFGSDLKLNGKDLSQKIDIDPKHHTNTRLPASLDTDAFSLPLIFRFGIATTLVKTKYHKFLTAIDMIHPSNNSESLNLGAEYVFLGGFSIRTGYESLFERDYDVTGGMTIGGGIKLYTLGMLVIFDYAYRDFGVLENVSRFSFGIKF
jgi:hypothetical protein